MLDVRLDWTNVRYSNTMMPNNEIMLVNNIIKQQNKKKKYQTQAKAKADAQTQVLHKESNRI